MARQSSPWRFIANLKFGTRLALGFGVGLVAVLSISMLTAAAFSFSARQQLALQEQNRKLDFATELARTTTEIQLAAVRFVSLGHESAKERALELLNAWAPRLDACEARQCLKAARIRTVQEQFAQFSATFELVATSRGSISKTMSEDFSSIQTPATPDFEARTSDATPTGIAVLHANSVNDHIAAIEAQLHAYFVSSDFRRVEAAKSHFEELKSHQNFASLVPDQAADGQDKLEPAEINVQRIERIVNANIQRIRSYSYLTNVVMASVARELEYVATDVAREVNAEITSLRASIERSRSRFYRWLFAANIAILLVTIPIFLWVLHSVTSPLRHLADIFRRLAGGSEETIMKDIESRDEIADLYDAARRFREENINARRMLENYRRLSQTLENQVAERTLELKHKNEELNRLASLDDLTNTNNRRSLDRSLTKELTRATRYERPLVGHADSSVTLSRRTSAVGKARERRTGRSQFKRAERSPRCLCGGPSGATVPARLGVAFLGKGAAIPCETRLDSHRHSGSERYRTIRMAH